MHEGVLKGKAITGRQRLWCGKGVVVVVGEQSLPTTATALNTRAGLEHGPHRAQVGSPPQNGLEEPSQIYVPGPPARPKTLLSEVWGRHVGPMVNSPVGSYRVWAPSRHPPRQFIFIMIQIIESVKAPVQCKHI